MADEIYFGYQNLVNLGSYSQDQSTNSYLELLDGSSVGTSETTTDTNSGSGRFVYNDTNKYLEVSQNGGNYWSI